MARPYARLVSQVGHHGQRPLTVTGEPGATAAAGYSVTRGSLTYTTTAAVTLDSDGNGTVAASYSTAGAAGNTTAITTGTFTSTPTGFDSTVIIGIMSGGLTRNRILSCWTVCLTLFVAHQPAGISTIPPLGDVRGWRHGRLCLSLRRGLGTVDVVITSADGLPSAEIIAATQAYIDDVRPVTAKNCLVLGPTIKTVDLDIQVSLDGVTIDVARENIISTLTDYINKLPPVSPLFVLRPRC
jgi:uncharacterized phage protein gp47/JayE